MDQHGYLYGEVAAKYLQGIVVVFDNWDRNKASFSTKSDYKI